MNIEKNNKKPPEFFKPLLWSYNFDSLDLDANQKTVILAAINYGNLEHWRWVKKYYGQNAVAKILATVPATEFKRRAGKLAEILFNVKLNYAPRSAH